MPRDDCLESCFGTGPRITPHLGPNTPLLPFRSTNFEVSKRVAILPDVGIIHGGESRKIG